MILVIPTYAEESSIVDFKFEGRKPAIGKDGIVTIKDPINEGSLVAFEKVATKNYILRLAKPNEKTSPKRAVYKVIREEKSGEIVFVAQP